MEEALLAGRAIKPFNAPPEAVCSCGAVYCGEAGRKACFKCTKSDEFADHRKTSLTAICVECGVEFNRVRGMQKACSPVCQRQNHLRVKRAYRASIK